MTTSLQPQLIQRLERKFLESVLQILELKCMAVEKKQLYLRGGSRQKIEPCLNMFEFVSRRLNTNPVHVHKSLQNLTVLSLSRVSSKLC